MTLITARQGQHEMASPNHEGDSVQELSSSSEDKIHKRSFVVGTEAYELLRLAAPAVVQLCTMQALVVTNQILVGHLGATPLAAAALGITVSPPLTLDVQDMT